ncbi:sushi, von Willebrand factor type A, EGF and pentraxin domain-containing protein 1-like [Haliotis rufescens]|uniref:sushi, von Willebrand factor type A, EGF and pentraxin domain-containing protein 1-like n=1 Tax=Haliotis rufescens TaxID=6454 RepID=UPI00201F60F3|nr:sushi, von Willebrand factor type A, EGF and pentraxin domain-containing protein 1-like [Haliotis rufescens]
MTPGKEFALLVVFLLSSIHDVKGECVDNNSQCDYWASVDECLITPAYTMCQCKKACNEPSTCDPTSSNDTRCECRSLALQGQCSIPAIRADCSTTCDHRDRLECLDAPSFDHAHTVPIKSKYFFLDTVNYDCDEGYYNVGSKPALVCNETAQWKYARRVTYPDCILIECTSPPTLAHASWEGSSFDYNNSVVYTCELGYEAAAGNDVRTCNSSKMWSGDDLVCERVTCGDPPPFQHAVVTFNLVEATYTCDTGYKARTPSAVKLCSVYGNWTGPDLECTLISCGDPPTLNNTGVMNVNTTFRSEAMYTCSKGHNSVGGEAIKVCAENASWTGSDLVCEAVSCGPPIDVENTEWSAQLHIYQSEAAYNCVVGYEQTGGHGVKVCMETGAWDGNDLQCEVRRCGTPPLVANADVTNTNDTYLSEASYTCKTGYNRTGGDVTKSCDQTSSWQGSDIVCTAVDCSIPPSVPNTDRVYTNTTYRSIAEYSCLKGYNSSMTNWTITCNETTEWVGALPTCYIIDCNSPREVAMADVTVRGTTYQSEATYTCNQGYNLVGGSSKKTCADTGHWESADFSCEIVDCGPAPDVNKAKYVSTGSAYEANANYSCIVGYKEAGGRAGKVCTEFGRWSGEDLNCTIVTCAKAPEIGHAHLTGNYTPTYRSTATYSCDLGYDEDGGNTTLVCTEEGVWHGMRLKCKERPSAAEAIGVIKKFEPVAVEASGSVGFGVVAYSIMGVLLLVMLLLDLATFYKHLMYMKENVKDFWESRRPARSISLPEKHRTYSSEA